MHGAVQYVGRLRRYGGLSDTQGEQGPQSTQSGGRSLADGSRGAVRNNEPREAGATKEQLGLPQDRKECQGLDGTPQHTVTSPIQCCHSSLSPSLAPCLDGSLRHEDIDDLITPDGGAKYTDGCGYCSREFARYLSKHLGLRHRGSRYEPCVFQVRVWRATACAGLPWGSAGTGGRAIPAGVAVLGRRGWGWGAILLASFWRRALGWSYVGPQIVWLSAK